jgi:diguanylate cyclase (GGDEF)-like protein
MRILIAEDEPVSRRILERIVGGLGHEAVIARDGDEAWAALAPDTGAFDVVISDWLMPGLGGVDLCERVRAHADVSYTYFILVTALDGKERYLSGMQAGADDYLTKPVDAEALEARLLVAARVTSLHRDLAAKSAELERMNRVLHASARTDPLTQLGNRLRLREDLDALLVRQREGGCGVVATLIDVDHFKPYNDTHGHLAGDEILKSVAATIRDGVRAADGTYRFGGEEFIVTMLDVTLEDAAQAVDRVRREVRALSLPHAASSHGVVTVSAGLAEFPPSTDVHVDQLLRAADKALYVAKKAGRDRVAVARGDAIGVFDSSAAPAHPRLRIVG